jgi:hypothetical protein
VVVAALPVADQRSGVRYADPLRPVAHRFRDIDLPLGEITKAIDLVATGSNLGRVVLRTR